MAVTIQAVSNMKICGIGKVLYYADRIKTSGVSQNGDSGICEI